MHGDILFIAHMFSIVVLVGSISTTDAPWFSKFGCMVPKAWNPISIPNNDPARCFQNCGPSATFVALQGKWCNCHREFNFKPANPLYSCAERCPGNNMTTCGNLKSTTSVCSIYAIEANHTKLTTNCIPINGFGCVAVTFNDKGPTFILQECNLLHKTLCCTSWRECSNTEIEYPWSNIELSCLNIGDKVISDIANITSWQGVALDVLYWTGLFRMKINDTTPASTEHAMITASIEHTVVAASVQNTVRPSSEKYTGVAASTKDTVIATSTEYAIVTASTADIAVAASLAYTVDAASMEDTIKYAQTVEFFSTYTMEKSNLFEIDSSKTSTKTIGSFSSGSVTIATLSNTWEPLLNSKLSHDSISLESTSVQSMPVVAIDPSFEIDLSVEITTSIITTEVLTKMPASSKAGLIKNTSTLVKTLPTAIALSVTSPGELVNYSVTETNVAAIEIEPCELSTAKPCTSTSLKSRLKSETTENSLLEGGHISKTIGLTNTDKFRISESTSTEIITFDWRGSLNDMSSSAKNSLMHTLPADETESKVFTTMNTDKTIAKITTSVLPTSDTEYAATDPQSTQSEMCPSDKVPTEAVSTKSTQITPGTDGPNISDRTVSITVGVTTAAAVIIVLIVVVIIIRMRLPKAHQNRYNLKDLHHSETTHL